MIGVNVTVMIREEAMTTQNGWVNGLIGLLVLGAAGVVYLGFAGRISISTLALLEVCILALGVIAFTFWKRMSRPAESIEQLLYKTEHPKSQ